ncbi:MAG: type VI secretion system ATPase TssH [Rhodospirillaceae bacterium]|nr:type VI secretion system ATPase TssH [Rhodospirillaceae bacterium]
MDLDVKTLIARMNPICRLALQEAAQLCVSQTNFYVEIEHFLSKLVQVERSDLGEILKAYDIKLASFSAQLTGAIEGFKRGAGRTPTFAPLLPKLLQEAWLVSSLELKEESIRSGGILLALLDNNQLREAIIESTPILEEVPISQLKTDLKSLVNFTVEAVKNKGKQNGSSENKGQKANKAGGPEADAIYRVKKTGQALEKYTINVSDEAQKGTLDDIIGRDLELAQAIDILMRRRQNNPLLIGDPGVGKTALVEALANAVARGDVPPTLSNIEVRSLDLGLLQAGAGVRGEFEERLKSVIDDVKKSPVPIILFIDEAHTLIGAGGTAGQGDAANLLKPALARGELRTIGATTWSEYKKYIEKDAALARRFQLVHVKEPEPEVAVSMLRGVAPSLEKHHGVLILESGLKEAVALSSRYIVGRQLPDKAISVLDTACSRVAIAQNSKPLALQGLSHQLIILKSEFDRILKEQQIGKADESQINEVADEIAKLENEKLELEARYNSEKELVKKVIALRGKLNSSSDEQLPSDEDRQQLDSLQLQLDNIQENQPMVPVQVDGSVIADVISGWTGIPVGKMVSDEIKSIINLGSHMSEYIIGQSDAISEISKRIQTARANLNEPGKPTGVFLLVGPSGVGKTETATALADLLYGGEEKMITINMSEYQEAHTVAGLKGAPPGYVGYGSGGVLTEAVRRNPYSVILLDEFEKAHPDVGELFYQVFDKGMLEDSEGQEVNFKNSLIIMTSNLGAEAIIDACVERPDRPSSQELIDLIRPHLQSHFKAALLGRMSIIPYLPLNNEEYGKIVEIKLAKIKTRIMDRYNASLSYNSDVVERIVASCEEIESGARVVDRILNQTLLPGLSGKVLDKIATGDSFQNIKISLSYDNDFEYHFED